MFRRDESRSHIAAPPEAIVALAESINQPLVAVPGLPSQAAQAVVVAVRAGREVDVRVHLHLLADNQGVLYVWDEGPVGAEGLRDVWSEALGFVESLGFMMENVDWRAQSKEQRAELVARLGAFHHDLSEFGAGKGQEATGPREQVDPKVLELARILASF